MLAKLFKSPNTDMLEVQLNDWLRVNDGKIRIFQILQSASGEHTNWLFLTVFYELKTSSGAALKAYP